MLGQSDAKFIGNWDTELPIFLRSHVESGKPQSRHVAQCCGRNQSLHGKRRKRGVVRARAPGNNPLAS